ncbi:hypothetical protein M3Y98_00163600 [Aphelenchoides besseyi]|nr:hypothetical protein M3Y98_00163600 [Aphelenchoides besseyi]KAI6199933.1 hypothetical protein M3Y96_00679800 [Aphelenchoides besseyi]
MYAAAKNGQTAERACDEKKPRETKEPAQVLDQIQRLQDDCATLNDLIERILISSGICRRYTHPDEIAYCNLQQPHQCETARSTPMHVKATSYGNAVELISDLVSIQRPVVRPRPSPSRTSSAPIRPTRSSAAYRQRFFVVRSEPSFDRYTVSAFQRIRTPKVASRYKPLSKWVPRITIPQPFKMTIREQYTRGKSTYSKRFVEKLLREKHKKQLAELREHQKTFKAHAVPRTTYEPDLPAKIGQLKRRSKSAIAKKTESPTPKRFHSNPVPVTTFIPPSDGIQELRKQQRFQRALALLAVASEPGNMHDHSTRWKVQQELRHKSRCFQRNDETEKIRSKSVPDFKRLHFELEEKLNDLRISQPITLTEPFHFHSDYPKHYCKQWTFEQERRFLKRKFITKTLS